MSKTSRPKANEPADEPSRPAGPETRRLMGSFGIGATVFFLAIWLLPITYVGSAGRDIRWMHRDLRHMQRVACLFTKEVGAWGTYHIEIRTERGGPWIELPLDGYFDMSIFGYRTRFHRLIGKSYRRGGGRARSQYLARWIAERYATRHPGAAPLQGVRFVSASRTVKTLLAEEGRFRKLPLAEMPRRRRRVVMTFEGESMRYVPKRRRKRGSKAPAKARPRVQPLPARTPPAPKRAPSGTTGGQPPRLSPLPVPGTDASPGGRVELEALPLPGSKPGSKPATEAEPVGGER